MHKNILIFLRVIHVKLQRYSKFKSFDKSLQLSWVIIICLLFAKFFAWRKVNNFTVFK